MRDPLVRVALFVGAFLCGATTARADFVAYEFSEPGFVDSYGNWSLGFQFRVKSDFNVTALGFYDDLGDGLTESHAVGLFAEDGTLLASTTVSNSNALEGHFRYQTITPVALTAGAIYRLAAVTGSEFFSCDNKNPVFDSHIEYLADVFSLGPNLEFPEYQQLPENQAGFFGPNFKGSSTTEPIETPEPGTLTLLGLGAASFAGYCWRRRQTSTSTL